MANWYYYDANGNKIGPIRGRELKQFAQQGTIAPDTRVEDENGLVALAKQVTGLTFPGSSPYSITQPESEEPSSIIVPSPPSQPMANWYYYNENPQNGNLEEFGPITVSELKQLVRDGMIAPENYVKDPTGRTGLAKDVKGLTFTKAGANGQNSAVAPPLSQPEAIPVPTPVPKELHCTNCGKTVSEQAVACMSCGVKPTGHRKFCRQCAAPLNPEQVACIKCGTVIPGKMQNFVEGAKNIKKKVTDKFTNAVRAISGDAETLDSNLGWETSQCDNSPGGKINKVVVVGNTVRGADAVVALLFPIRDYFNLYADKLEKQFSETLAAHNRQGWKVVSVTYGDATSPKLSLLESLLFMVCLMVLSLVTFGIYLTLYVLFIIFVRGRKGQYTVILEKDIPGVEEGEEPNED